MSGVWSASGPRPDPPLLDDEVWDAPRRISHDELFNHINPGWRRSGRPPEDPQDER